MDSKFESDSGGFLEGEERDVFHSAALEPRREQNMQLEQQHSVKWSLLELMSALSVRTLKCLLTRACSSSANTSHRIILSPVFSSPWQGEERLIWAAAGQKTQNKDLAQTNFNTVNLTWTLVSWCFCFCLPWMCPCQSFPMKMIKNVLKYMSPCLCRAHA